MDSMDLKGIAWVGHIYQKFEAMCLEVEEAMSQETAKYVENQVQTVGAGMKRFCSDVMQDLLPPSSKDLASADLLINPYLEFGIHKKPISNIKEDAINFNPVCVKGISEDKSNSSNDDWVDWSAASFNWEISDKDGENCDKISMRTLNKTAVTNVSTKSSAKVVKRSRCTLNKTAVTNVSTKSSAKVVKRSRCISSNNILRAQPSDKCESGRSVSQAVLQATSNELGSQSIDGDVSHTDSCENSSKQMSPPQIVSNVSANTHYGQSVGEDVFRRHTERSTDCDPDLEEETKNDASVLIIEHEFESDLEETCVLVDGNDFHLDNHKEEIRRSYKKKIQNAFSLKKKPARKQEYKQLAAQYSIANAETDIKCDEAIQLASKNINANKLETHDSLESEWELL